LKLKTKRPDLLGAFLLGVEFWDDLNFAHDVLIKLTEIFGGNPVFEMPRAADLLHRKLRQIACFYGESRDLSNFRLATFRVPVARYLRGILFVQDRIKNCLPRQPPRKDAVFGISNEAKFVRSDRAIENCGLFHSFGADTRKLAGKFNISRVGLRLRQHLSFFRQAIEVEGHGPAHILLDFFACAAG
jgi:hypothetical protein